jgi:hypothetical protein
MATPTTLPATFVAGTVLTAQQMNDLRGAFRVLQVVSTTKTDTFSTTSTTPTDITGASVTITPSATSSLVYVLFTFAMGSSQACEPAVQLLRGATVIGGGAAAGSRLSAASGVHVGGSAQRQHMVHYFLDTPNTTSATTYSLKAFTNVGTIYVGRGGTDTDSASSPFVRTPLTITAMEISA